MSYSFFIEDVKATDYKTTSSWDPDSRESFSQNAGGVGEFVFLDAGKVHCLLLDLASVWNLFYADFVVCRQGKDDPLNVLYFIILHVHAYETLVFPFISDLMCLEEPGKSVYATTNPLTYQISDASWLATVGYLTTTQIETAFYDSGILNCSILRSRLEFLASCLLGNNAWTLDKLSWWHVPRQTGVNASG